MKVDRSVIGSGWLAGEVGTGVARRPAVSTEAVRLGGEVAECYMSFHCLKWARASRLLAIRSERTGAIVLLSWTS